MSEINYITKIQTTDGTKYPIGSSIWVSTSGQSWNGKSTTEIESEIKNNFINSKNIEWASLKSLRDNSGLVPGMQYRITDYVTTSTQADTRSAGNLFDVIVTAVDTNKLSELAYAIQSERDVSGYFANSDLNSWELKYCIDNDTTRFGWADETNGKGVIYWMKDEYNNECPYDFKNIQFKRYAITDITSTKLTSDALNELKSIFVKNNNGGLYFAAKDFYGRFVPLNENGTPYTINENDFNWYYTFQGFYSVDGSTINKMYDLTVEIFKLTDECISYLQNKGRSVNNTENYCGENKIEQFNQEKFLRTIQYKGRQILNNIVFIGGLNCCYETGDTSSWLPWKFNTSQIFGNRFGMNCNSNTFGNNCYSNTFGNGCYSNTFGNNCYSNTFGNECGYNIFGNEFYSNTFRYQCYYNIFGSECYSNTFGDFCGSSNFGSRFQNNTFGNACQLNTFGNDCASNTFGNGCMDSIFGYDCSYNTIGNNYSSSTFGNECYKNTFGDGCDSNTFGNSCSYNTFGNDCYSNTFGNNCYNNTFGNTFQNNTFGNEYYNNTFESEISEIKNNFINSKNIEWASLKSLRDNSGLIPGMQYRITDYVTTSTQADTRSAGNLFDVIVTAVDENKLSELAYAIQSERDVTGYFANSDLNSWELKYCIDNDTTRFGWADETNGKGVIYWMKDEYNNECPYDFKNIQFKRYAITDITSTKLTSDAVDNLKAIFVKDYNYGFYYAAKDCSGNFVPSNVNGTSYTINENDYMWYYTFQGFYTDDVGVELPTITKMYDLTVEIFKLTDECISYLQNNDINVETENYCGGNKIEKFDQEFMFKDDILNIMQHKGRQILNNIVFIGFFNFCSERKENDGTTSWVFGTSQIFGNRFGMNCNSNTVGDLCYYNTFGNECYNNTFGNNCYSNTFDSKCNDNTFGNECYSNTFGNQCYSNTFGNQCYSNTFGNKCYSNTFGNKCYSNTFGNECYNNTFENQCYSNTFGYGCYSNTFGNECYSNTFGNGCYDNTFGNECYSNTFNGAECYSNSFGNKCYKNTFEKSCQYNTFGNGCYSNTFGNECYSNTFGNECSSNKFGNKCHKNIFGNSCSSNKFGNNCYRNTFVNNCSYNTFINNCNSNIFGNSCSRNTFENNCYNNTFGNSCNDNAFKSECSLNTFGNGCNNNTFGNHIEYSQFGDDVMYFSITISKMTYAPSTSDLRSYIKWLVVENGVRYVNAYVTNTTSSTSYCQNVRICLGIQGTNSNRKTFDITSCINSGLNNVYQPTNSQITNV